MPQALDLVVLGSGTAASTIAIQGRATSRRAAVAHCHPFSGTCTWRVRGCTSKEGATVRPVDTIKRMRLKGVTASPVAIGWSSLMHFKYSFTDSTPA